MKLKRICKICLLFLLLLSLAGCWDQKGLDRQVFVIGIGIDKAEENGKINVTYLIANPEVGTSPAGGSTDEPALMTVTMRASDFVSMRNNANTIIAREISYDLLSVIFVSEEFAQEEEFIRFLYTAEKDREIKRDVTLVVTKEKVKEFFEKNNPKFLKRPHKYYEFMLERGTEIGVIPDSELHHFFRVTEEDANLFLSAYATTQVRTKKDKFRINEMDALAGDLRVEGDANNAQFLGSAVFLEGKMIGTLTGVENRIVMFLHDAINVRDVLTVFPDPFKEDYHITVRIMKQKKTKVKMDLKAKPPRIHVTLPLTLDILTDPSMENPVESKKKVEKLRNALEKKMESAAMEVVRISQEEFKAEPFGWSLHARREFKTLQEYMDFDWMKTYPKMKVDIDVEIRFGKFGRQPRTPSYEGVRD
ncbi:MAG: Ger(x)C family spore germination protein [Bacillota bacterium]